MPAKVRCGVVHGLVEVATAVGGGRRCAVQGRVLEEEELDLGVDVAAEAEVGGAVESTAQDVRESAQLGVPSGMATSQNMRAEWWRPLEVVQGRI